VLRLDLAALAPHPPELPHRPLGALAQLTVSAALHVTVAGSLWAMVASGIELRAAESTVDRPAQPIVFRLPELPRIGPGGGGGGGQRQPRPIRRAEAVGSDPITMRVRKQPAPAAPVTSVSAPVTEAGPALPSMVLEAKPLAGGFVDQIGLPTTAMSLGTSAGPGSGGGVGTGIGTGVGPGRGPGLGPGSGGGSGGGTGGGTYRPGGAVSSPRLLVEVKPRYTPDALRLKIQGTVVLEAIVGTDGFPSHIRVVRSLDRGLDAEAAVAAAQWRFEPGRLAGVPVDVLVTIMIDFKLW
jgi:TonB family protein